LLVGCSVISRFCQRRAPKRRNAAEHVDPDAHRRRQRSQLSNQPIQILRCIEQPAVQRDLALHVDRADAVNLLGDIKPTNVGMQLPSRSAWQPFLAVNALHSDGFAVPN
jgi:hypothetical protein